MSKFGHIKKLEVVDATAWIDLPDIGKGARLCLKYAGDSNKAYYNAYLKRSGNRARHAARTDTIDVSMVEDSRDDDRALFPLYVITGWENIMDDKNKQVPFNRANVTELLEILPGWIFDKIRTFAQTPERFLPEGEEMAPDAQELAKN